MQGTILSAGRAQGIILGDDGVRYTFTPAGWREPSVTPQVGLRVDFEIRGSHAVAIYPIPGSVPPSSHASMPGQPPPGRVPTPPSPLPPTPGSLPAQSLPGASSGPSPDTSAQLSGASTPAREDQQGAPPTQPAPPERRGFGSRWWHWALVGGGVAVVAIVVVAAFLLGLFGTGGPPEGREIARHTHEGTTYVLVEYGKELAIFTESGSPVRQPGLAEEILRSYAWRQTIEDFNIEGLSDVAERVQRIDDSVSDVRELSNSVVSVFDQLHDLEARVPLLGSVSAMDVVSETFPAVGESERLIRSLDSELNDLGRNAASLTGASRQIRDADPASVSGKEMEAVFTDASVAAADLESTAGSVQDSVSQVEGAVGDLSTALRAGSDTPLIGDALGGFARQAERFESELSGLSGLLGEIESDLDSLGQELEDALKSADDIHSADVDRWLAEPYDDRWPPTGLEREDSSDGARTANDQGEEVDARTFQSEPFDLDLEFPGTAIDVGEWFTLVVRMYDVQQAGEHGGISVSFPTLTGSGGSSREYGSSIAKVEALDYTSGLSNVTFYQPGATIYHRQNNLQFPAEYLLVESDDPTWSHTDDRTLRLRIAPLRSGGFPVLVRGWLCADQYTGCDRNPSSAADTDQQGWPAVLVWVSVNVVKTE